jgi:hypothetical protein
MVNITGISVVGKTISGVPGTWDSGVKQSYQWLRDGTVIPNAVSKTYKLTAADVGHTLSFRLTAVKPGYTTVVATSSPTLPITN